MLFTEHGHLPKDHTTKENALFHATMNCTDHGAEALGGGAAMSSYPLHDGMLINSVLHVLSSRVP